MADSLAGLNGRAPNEVRARELFEAARRLAGAEQTDFVERACPNGSLRARVEQLLQRHAQLGGFLARAALDRAVWERIARGVSVDDGLPADTRIGPFRIEGVLAIGGASVVYRARQTDVFDRPVALKVSPIVDDEDLVLSQSEVQLAVGVEHPSLVQILGHGHDTERGLHYCAMRLVGGANWEEQLGRRLETGDVASGARRREIVRQAAQIARGLGALHRAGLVHRDVKPANVVVEGHAGQEHAVLVDFGLLRAVDGRGRPTRAGTPGYRAPEVDDGGQPSPASDVFGLGAATIDLLLPTKPEERHEKIRDGSLRAAGGRRLAAVLERAVTVDPARRWRSGDELAAELDAWLRGKVGRSTLRRRQRIAAAAALAVALLAVLVLWLWRRTAVNWREGRLTEVAAMLGAGPSFCEAAIVEDSTSAPALVLHEIGRSGVDKALTLAARLVQRDGVGIHPQLEGFLAHEIRRGSRAGLVALARCFVERPLEGLADVERAAILRHAVRSRLDQTDDALWAATALAGCGAASDVDLLLGWAEHGRPSSTHSYERVRLAIESAAAILARRGARGELGELSSARLEAWLARSDALAQPMITSTLYVGVAAARKNLAHAVAIAARQAEISTVALPGGLDLATRLLNDPTAASELATVSLALEDLPAHPGGRYIRFRGYGVAAAAAGDAAVRAFDNRIRDLPFDDGQRARALAAFATGVDRGREIAVHGALHAPLDPDSHLEAWFDAAAHVDREVPLRVRPRGNDDEDLVAAWDFLPLPAEGHGVGLTLVARSTTVEPDAVVPEQHYLRMALPSLAELRLGFTAPAPTTRTFQLRLYVQNAARPLIPFGGSTALRITFDGRLVESDFAVAGPSDQHLSLSLGSVLDAGRHTIDLAFADATTTLRVYAIEVRQR